MIKHKIDILEKLKQAGYSSYRLRNEKIFGQSTIQRFRDNDVCEIPIIDKLCELLNCQPGDILEYVPDETEKE